MNVITDAISVARILVTVAQETIAFASWDYHEIMGRQFGDDTLELDTDEIEPLSAQEAGRLALEFVMTGRVTKGDARQFQQMMGKVVEEIDSPQHAVDVIMSLAGMVNVLAEDDDLAHFGEHILASEATR